MVLGIHIHAAADGHHHNHGEGYERRHGRRHDQDQGPGTESASARTTPASACCTGPKPAHEHHVLNNGHGIKHLATHEGYARAADGVRLFFQVHESHRRVPVNSGGSEGASTAVSLPQCPDTPTAVPLGCLAAASASLGSSGSSTLSEAVAVGRLTSSPKDPAADFFTMPAPAVEPAEAMGSGPGRLPAAEGCRAGSAATAAATESAATAAATGSAATAAVTGSAATAAVTGSAATAVASAKATAGQALDTGGGMLQGGSSTAEPDVANILLIMGFAAGRDGWLPLIDHWLSQATSEPLHHLRVRFCVFDNRGIGESDTPTPRSSYSTDIMAGDALAVMDHLGWRQAHVVGFSMGGMVALKLAVAAPGRLSSLTALSVTNGGWQIIPTKWRALKLLLWAAAARTPQQRAHADVHFHFSRDTLHTEIPIPGASGPGEGSVAAKRKQRVETALIDEYVATSQACAAQPHAGLMGQLYAVWTHSLSAAEQHRLKQLHVPMKVIHGYHDMMAMPEYGERIAKHVRAAFIMLNGGHFIARECAPEVCMHIADSVATVKRF